MFTYDLYFLLCMEFILQTLNRCQSPIPSSQPTGSRYKPGMSTWSHRHVAAKLGLISFFLAFLVTSLIYEMVLVPHLASSPQRTLF